MTHGGIRTKTMGLIGMTKPRTPGAIGIHKGTRFGFWAPKLIRIGIGIHDRIGSLLTVATKTGISTLGNMTIQTTEADHTYLT